MRKGINSMLVFQLLFLGLFIFISFLLPDLALAYRAQCEHVINDDTRPNERSFLEKNNKFTLTVRNKVLTITYDPQSKYTFDYNYQDANKFCYVARNKANKDALYKGATICVTRFHDNRFEFATYADGPQFSGACELIDRGSRPLKSRRQ